MLWGEIRNFIQSSKYPLEHTKGGPLVVNHLHIRKIYQGKIDGLSYLLGRVAQKGEGMLGHHIADRGDGVPRTLLIGDEASGLENVIHEKSDTWTNRKLYIGNCYPCSNFFKAGVKAGNHYSEDGKTCYRKVIKIKCADSPNVRFAEAEKRLGREPSNTLVVHGVMPYPVYAKRRATWDKVRQCICLDAEFYEGAELLLFPPTWLNRAETYARVIKFTKRKAFSMGVDPAEGGDKSSWTIIDHMGVIKKISMQTPDTTVIPRQTIALINQYKLDPRNVVFDRGGGGKQAADTCREAGYPVRTVAFGETVGIELKRSPTQFEEKIEAKEEGYTFVNRRAQIYGEMSEMLDPANEQAFAIPEEYEEYRLQLAPIPKLYDREGRLRLLPKNKKDPKSNEKTLVELIGHSPDEADSLGLAIHGMLHPPTVHRVGGF